MRLQNTILADYLAELPIYYLPIEVTFQDQDAIGFNQQINNYVRTNSVNCKIYKRENK
jgi:hypothetical protein